MTIDYRSIHLYHQPRITKKRGRVNLYSLATSFYDENGKNQKSILLNLGELGETQAKQCKVLLKAINEVRKGLVNPESITADLSQVTFEGLKQYLDVFILNELWNTLNLHTGFCESDSYDKDVSSEKIARILVFNRILEPSSKVATIAWFKNTWLSKLIGIDEKSYNRSKIFRSLEKIHACKPRLEKIFWGFSQKQIEQKIRVYYFDGSTSWFEGTHCNLAKADKEKTRGYYEQVVGLMMITDNKGYPVAWDIVPGNKKDTTAFKILIDRVAKTYGIKEITYCFDRGVASEDNFLKVEECKSKFITAIRDNQIKSIFDVKKFKSTRQRILKTLKNPKEKNTRSIVDIDGFFALGKRTFFKELGIQGNENLRYVISFNESIFEKKQSKRRKNIELSLAAICELNVELILAKRDRDFNVIERELLEILSKNKVRNFFSYALHPLLSNDKAQSFRIELSMLPDAISEAELTDGLLVYVTDHTENTKNKGIPTFDLSAWDIVGHYKAKYVIENSFRELKSFIDLRPFYVWTEAHVKAHYDIAVVAYFINNYIYRVLQPLGISLRTFYKLLKVKAPVLEIVSEDGTRVFKLQEIDKELQRSLIALDINLPIKHTFINSIH